MLKNRLNTLRTSLGYSDELVSLIERMVAVEEFDRIPISEVCQALSRAKYGGDLSDRESSVNSIEEEYRDYYGDFDNEMVQNYRDNHKGHNYSNNSPMSHGNSHHQAPVSNYRSKGVQPEPFQEITQQEARNKYEQQKKRKSSSVNSYGKNYSPQVYNPENRMKQGNSSNSKFNPRNFEFSKQKNPMVSRSQRRESAPSHHPEYGYYQDNPSTQNENHSIPNNSNSHLKPGYNQSSSKNLLSGGYRLSNVNMGMRSSQVQPHQSNPKIDLHKPIRL